MARRSAGFSKEAFDWGTRITSEVVGLTIRVDIDKAGAHFWFDGPVTPLRVSEVVLWMEQLRAILDEVSRVQKISRTKKS